MNKRFCALLLVGLMCGVGVRVLASANGNPQKKLRELILINKALYRRAKYDDPQKMAQLRNEMAKRALLPQGIDYRLRKRLYNPGFSEFKEFFQREKLDPNGCLNANWNSQWSLLGLICFFQMSQPCSPDYKEHIQYLFDQGADPNKEFIDDGVRITPLELICKKDCGIKERKVYAASILLQNKKTKVSFCALELAQEANNYELMKLLQKTYMDAAWPNPFKKNKRYCDCKIIT